MKKEKKTIENIVWILPRPRRKNKYKGGFPAHFEKKLFELYGFNPLGVWQSMEID